MFAVLCSETMTVSSTASTVKEGPSKSRSQQFWKVVVTPPGETLHTYAFQLTQDLSKVRWVLPRVDPQWHDRMITLCPPGTACPLVRARRPRVRQLDRHRYERQQPVAGTCSALAAKAVGVPWIGFPRAALQTRATLLFAQDRNIRQVSA